MDFPKDVYRKEETKNFLYHKMTFSPNDSDYFLWSNYTGGYSIF